MRWLPLLTLVLLAAPAFAQENEAEKLYRAMEKKIRSAKSVHAVFDVEMTVESIKGKWKLKGSVHFEGNKYRIEGECDAGGNVEQLLLMSDAKSTYAKVGKFTQAANKKLEEKDMEKLRGFVARAGIAGGFINLGGLEGFSFDSAEKVDLDKMAAIKDFKLGANERIGRHETQVIEYQIDLGGDMPVKASVWINTSTRLPVKRAFEMETEGKRFRAVENYSTFTVNGKIDPKLFEMPK
jgi:hypothetical protein